MISGCDHAQAKQKHFLNVIFRSLWVMKSVWGRLESVLGSLLVLYVQCHNLLVIPQCPM